MTRKSQPNRFVPLVRLCERIAAATCIDATGGRCGRCVEMNPRCHHPPDAPVPVMFTELPLGGARLIRRTAVSAWRRAGAALRGARAMPGRLLPRMQRACAALAPCQGEQGAGWKSVPVRVELQHQAPLNTIACDIGRLLRSTQRNAPSTGITPIPSPDRCNVLGRVRARMRSPRRGCDDRDWRVAGVR